MAIVLKDFASRTLLSVNRVVGQVYSTLIKEFIPSGFKTQLFVMRVTGMWPTVDDPCWYKWLTIAALLLVTILSPMSLCVNLIFANTIEEIIEHATIPLNLWMIAIKAGLFYRRRHNLRDFFGIHAGLAQGAGRNTMTIDRVARANSRVHIAIMVLDVSSWFMAMIQSVLLTPGNGMVSSTSHWSYTFTAKRWVFLVVLWFQVCCTCVSVNWVATTDSLYIALMNTVCGHLTERRFYRHEKCDFQTKNMILFDSLAKQLSNIVSQAFLGQFGVSCLLLCASVYLLSVVRCKLKITPNLVFHSFIYTSANDNCRMILRTIYSSLL